MKYDNYTEKERALPPLAVSVNKVMYGACPRCTARLECCIGRKNHKIAYCSVCGQKILWEARK